MISFEAAGKIYRSGTQEQVALHPLDLRIAPGIFGIIGQSGAGKSTLLRLINRLERATHGRVEVEGEEVGALDAAGLRRLRRRVGMIFQHFNLLSSKTVAENVAFPLHLQGEASAAHIRAEVARLLSLVGLADHANKYPAQLSGGQKQRVGIARALASGPRILLCDEATSALDPQTTASVLDLLARLQRELGLNIVLITHEMEVIRRICDQVAVLDAGHLVETGSVADVFLSPQHPTTRRFLGESGLGDLEPAPSALAASQGRLVRLRFRGSVTHDRLLSGIARDSGVDFAILAGRIDQLRGVPHGELSIVFDGEAARIGDALSRLAAAGVSVEPLQTGIAA